MLSPLFNAQTYAYMRETIHIYTAHISNFSSSFFLFREHILIQCSTHMHHILYNINYKHNIHVFLGFVQFRINFNYSFFAFGQITIIVYIKVLYTLFFLLFFSILPFILFIAFLSTYIVHCIKYKSCVVYIVRILYCLYYSYIIVCLFSV